MQNDAADTARKHKMSKILQKAVEDMARIADGDMQYALYFSFVFIGSFIAEKAGKKIFGAYVNEIESIVEQWPLIRTDASHLN